MDSSFQRLEPSSLSPAHGSEETSTLHLLPVISPTSSHIFLKLSSLCFHLVLVGSFRRGCSPAFELPICRPRTTVPFFFLNSLIMRLQTLIWSSYPNKWRKEAAYMILIFLSNSDKGEEALNTSLTRNLLFRVALSLNSLYLKSRNSGRRSLP